MGMQYYVYFPCEACGGFCLVKEMEEGGDIAHDIHRLHVHIKEEDGTCIAMEALPRLLPDGSIWLYVYALNEYFDDFEIPGRYPDEEHLVLEWAVATVEQRRYRLYMRVRPGIPRDWRPEPSPASDRYSAEFGGDRSRANGPRRRHTRHRRPPAAAASFSTSEDEHAKWEARYTGDGRYSSYSEKYYETRTPHDRPHWKRSEGAANVRHKTKAPRRFPTPGKREPCSGYSSDQGRSQNTRYQSTSRSPWSLSRKDWELVFELAEETGRDIDACVRDVKIHKLEAHLEWLQKQKDLRNFEYTFDIGDL